MDAPSVTVKDFSLRRGRRVVVPGLDLALEPGITALLGPNGAGKTTLLEGLSQPWRAVGGSLTLSGNRISETRASRRWYQSRLGYMPQHWQHFPSFTVEDSVRYTCWLKLVPRADAEIQITQALEAVDLLDKRTDLVRALSGGMRQRVGLAEALANQPSLVLLDEPTVGLDPAQRAAFRDALVAMKRGRVILLSTHLTDDVAAIADRVVVMAEGRIWFDGPPSALANRSTSTGDFSVRLERGYLNTLETDFSGAQ